MSVQETSRAVYYSEILPQLGDRQKLVYESIKQHSNITNNELSAYLNIPINATTPRTNELVKLKLVTEDVKRPCKISGRTSIAWRVTRNTLFPI